MSGVITITVNEEGSPHFAVEDIEGDSVPYDVLSKGVDGYIERVSCRVPEAVTAEVGIEPFPFDIWVNEEGLLRDLPVNIMATWLARSSGWRGERLVGNVVITSGVSEDGETRPLDEMQQAILLVFFTGIVDLLSRIMGES